MLRDGEAEAAAGDVLGAAFVDAIKTMKNSFPFGQWNPLALIGYPYHAGIRLLGNVDRDRMFVAAVLDRVVDQIGERLLQPVWIGADARVAAHGEVHVVLRRLIGKVFDEIGD